MKTQASGDHKQLLVVGPQWCQSTICLQQMRHNGAREPIYRHDSVLLEVKTTHSSAVRSLHRYKLSLKYQELGEVCQTLREEFLLKTESGLHPKILFEMWITCLDRVSANSEKGRGSEWAVKAASI